MTKFNNIFIIDVTLGSDISLISNIIIPNIANSAEKKAVCLGLKLTRAFCVNAVENPDIMEAHRHKNTPML